MGKEIEELCTDAIAARNKLIHRVLIDNAERLIDDVPRREVIKEIRDLRRTVRKADKMIRHFNEAFGAAIDGEDMGVPSKANIGKLDNPARLKINHQAETAPGV